MALLGVNPVNQKQEKEELSAWDKILKGLQIAQTGFGIAVDIGKIKTMAAEREKLELNSQGIHTAGDAVGLKGTMLPKAPSMIPQAAAPTAELKPPQASGGLRAPQFSPAAALKEEQALPATFAPPQAVDPSREKFEGLQSKTIKVKQGDEVKEFDYYADEDVKGRMTAEEGLRKERSSHEITRTTATLASSYARLRDVDNTPAGQLALVFSYMKMLDPGSTVRDNERADVQNATGVPDRIRNLWNGLMSGKGIGQAQINDIKTRATQLMRSQLAQQKRLDADFERLATSNGLRPKQIIIDVNADLPPTPEELAAEAKRRGLK